MYSILIFTITFANTVYAELLPFSPCIDGWKTYNYDFEGYNLTTYFKNNTGYFKENCESFCDLNENCYGYTWDLITGKCELKAQGITRGQVNNNIYSALKCTEQWNPILPIPLNYTLEEIDIILLAIQTGISNTDDVNYQELLYNAQFWYLKRRSELLITNETTYPPTMETTHKPIETTYPPTMETTHKPIETTYPPTMETTHKPIETTYPPTMETTHKPIETTYPPTMETTHKPIETTYPPTMETTHKPIETTYPPTMETTKIPIETTLKPTSNGYQVKNNIILLIIFYILI